MFRRPYLLLVANLCFAVPAAFEAHIAASASETEGVDRGITSNIALNPENHGAGACLVFPLMRSGEPGTTVAVETPKIMKRRPRKGGGRSMPFL